MLTIAPVLLPLFMLCFSAMIICAVISHWFGKEKLAVASRILCWITGIIGLPGILAGGLGLIVLTACYACYRVSERVRYKFRNPEDRIHPDYDKILDAGLD
ncbi:MAG TPA: hypothetical protein PK228_08475 [Saprospiraceae bacterium]|nr:hypothetical protein [Saprospiraceae bacterium]